MNKGTYDKLIAQEYDKRKPFIVINDNKHGIVWVKNISVYEYENGYYVEAKFKNDQVKWLFTLEGNALNTGINTDANAVLHIPDPSYVEAYPLHN